MPKQPKEDPTPTRLSEAISARMEEKGLTIKDVAVKVDIAYEHARRIVRGEAVPSRFVLKLICDELKLPYKQLLDLTNEAKIREKYGDLPLVMASKTPSMEPLDRVWGKLSESQQKDIIGMAQSWAKNNKGV